MNDRFKFRHWDKQVNKMRYGDIQLGSNGIPFIISPELPMLVQDIEDVITMQCTGLKDKNGKLIYEGDIVKFYFDRDKVIGVIAWDNEHQVGFYVNTTDYFKDKYITNYDFLCGFNYEVIGNIYENKELLNEI